MDGSISIEGLDKVLKGFDKADKDARKAAMFGLQKASMNIIADAQMNLRNNGSVVSNLLRQSGKVQKVDEETLDVGFFDTQNKQGGYAYYVEFGRRAGGMPPPEDMVEWVKKKYKLHDPKLIRKACWALAIKIASKGTRPHPFFIPAVNKNTKGNTLGGVLNSVTEATAKVIRHDTAALALKAREIRNTPVK